MATFLFQLAIIFCNAKFRRRATTPLNLLRLFSFVCRGPASWLITLSPATQKMTEWINKYFLHYSSWPNFESPRRSWRLQDLCCSLWLIRGMQTSFFLLVWEFLRFFPACFLYFVTNGGRTKGTPHFFKNFNFFSETDFFYLLIRILCVLTYCELELINETFGSNRLHFLALSARKSSLKRKGCSFSSAEARICTSERVRFCFSSQFGIPSGWLQIPTRRIPVCAGSDCSEQPLTSLLLPAASGSNSINRCLWVRI